MRGDEETTGADRSAEDCNLVLFGGKESVDDFAGDLARAAGYCYLHHRRSKDSTAERGCERLGLSQS